VPPEDKNKTRKPAPDGRKSAWAVSLLFLATAGGCFWGACDAGSRNTLGLETKVKTTLHLETFVLNLADPDQRSYLRVGIDLGLNRDLKTDEAVPLPEVRDTILDVLAQARGDELLTASGKGRLKVNLLHALQQRLPSLGVEEVYFTEFLIQR